MVEREPEEILDLVRWLPADSAVYAAARHPGRPDLAVRYFHWSDTQELVLHSLNTLQHIDYVQTQSADSKKKHPVPTPIESPRSEAKRAKANDANSIAMSLLKAAKKRS